MSPRHTEYNVATYSSFFLSFFFFSYTTSSPLRLEMTPAPLLDTPPRIIFAMPCLTCIPYIPIRVLSMFILPSPLFAIVCFFFHFACLALPSTPLVVAQRYDIPLNWFPLLCQVRCFSIYCYIEFLLLLSSSAHLSSHWIWYLLTHARAVLNLLFSSHISVGFDELLCLASQGGTDACMLIEGLFPPLAVSTHLYFYRLSHWFWLHHVLEIDTSIPCLKSCAISKTEHACFQLRNCSC